MEYRKLGRTGIEVSALGFGCGSVGGLLVRGTPTDQRAAIERAIAGGITYFDTAAAYGDGLSEQNLGRVLRELNANPVVGTKITLDKDEVQNAPSVLRANLQAGLKRLGRDRVDVCTLHGRIGDGLDLDQDDVCGPIAEGMRQLIEADLCRAVGFTGMGDADAVIAALQTGTFDYLQCAYSLSNPSAALRRGEAGVGEDYGGVLATASSMGAGVMGIRVLGGGLLSGDAEPHPNGHHNTHSPDSARHRLAAEKLAPTVDEFGLSSTAEVAVAFALSNPAISTVLVGISSEEQVQSALNAAQHAPLSAAALEQLQTAVR